MKLKTNNRFAEFMMDRRVAVLSYDKRGVGKSLSLKEKNLYYRAGMMDLVSDAVEARHYPGLPPVEPIGIAANIRESVGFLGVLVAANIAALLVYLIVIPLAPFVFYGLNGFLLGREYFRMVAVRRLGREAAASAYKQHFLTIWAAGILMAVPLTIPLMNLLVPVIGAAAFTHIFHRSQSA